jgi:hypothetical protein
MCWLHQTFERGTRVKQTSPAIFPLKWKIARKLFCMFSFLYTSIMQVFFVVGNFHAANNFLFTQKKHAFVFNPNFYKKKFITTYLIPTAIKLISWMFLTYNKYRNVVKDHSGHVECRISKKTEIFIVQVYRSMC